MRTTEETVKSTYFPSKIRLQQDIYRQRFLQHSLESLLRSRRVLRRETTVAPLKKRMNSLQLLPAAGERLGRLCNLNTGTHFALIRMPTGCLVLSFIKQLC